MRLFFFFLRFLKMTFGIYTFPEWVRFHLIRQFFFSFEQSLLKSNQTVDSRWKKINFLSNRYVQIFFSLFSNFSTISKKTSFFAQIVAKFSIKTKIKWMKLTFKKLLLVLLKLIWISNFIFWLIFFFIAFWIPITEWIIMGFLCL